MKIHMMILVFAGFLSGCAVGPRYHITETEVPERFREMDTAIQKSIANLPWWQVFQDQALQGLVREGLRNNYDLKIAAARVDESRAMIGVVRADMLPQTDLTAGVERDRNSQVLYPTLEPLTSTFSGGFNTFWEIDLWGRLRQKVRAAKSEALAIEEFRRGVIITLVADIAQAYFTLRELDLELTIAVNTLEIRKATYQLFVDRQKGGVASDLEVAQADADMCETEATIPNLKRLISIQENKISVLLGHNPGSIPRGLALSEQAPVPLLPPAGLPSELLNRRPDVIEADYLVRSTNALVGASMGEFLPRLDLVNFIGGEGRRPSDIFGNKGYAWTIGGNTDLPLFHGGRNVYHYQAVKAQWKQAVEDYRRTVVKAITEVSNFIVDIRRLVEIRAAQEKQVKADRYSTKLAKARYEGGFSSYLDVLDAERRRFASENSLAKTIGDQYVAFSNLYRALGGGWQPEKKTA